jgi:hypothetical protein
MPTAPADSLALARFHGLANLIGGTTATLATVSLVYGARGRISRVYLVDAAVELGFLVAWLLSDPAQRSLRPRR